jgi:hypothetical protein
VDAAVHSKHGKVINYNFKLGSVERSIDLDKSSRHTSAVKSVHFPTANKNWEVSKWWSLLYRFLALL